MNERKFDINSLSVASPCTVGWETMTGDERTRHCQLCDLNVYNVSELTRAEVERLVTKREGRMCIRMHRRADGTVLTRDCPVGLRAARKRVAAFAGAALASLLGLFSVSFGQRDLDASTMKISRVASVGRISDLTGTVTDAMGGVIVGARVVLSAGTKEFTVTSDERGVYHIPDLAHGMYHLSVSAPNFDQYRVKNLMVGEGQRVSLDVRLEVSPSELMGDVIFILVPTDPDPSSTIVTNVTPRPLIKPISRKP